MVPGADPHPWGVTTVWCRSEIRKYRRNIFQVGIFQEAVKKLAAKGEKITTFVVIAVAKQVIKAQDPALLHDSGGPIKLNTTWAKSMMRRLGIKNKM